ncbi:hypothetical protein BC629DRAFT_1287377, partial [Irpex lacteus]
MLCEKLSIRELREIAKVYSVPVRNHKLSRPQVLQRIQSAIAELGIEHVAVFRPLSVQTSSDRVRKYRIHNTKPVSPEQNKKACKKWRTGKTFPPKPPSVQKLHKIINDFVDDSAFDVVCESGCAVCGCLSVTTSMKLLSECDIDLSLLVNPDATKGERKLDGTTVENTPGPVLAPNCHLICTRCQRALNNGHVPRHSLANGQWLGEVPEELKDLSWMEQKLIAKINVSRAIVRVKESKLMQMKTNVVCRAAPSKVIYNTLPPKLTDFEEVIAIIFLGPNPPTPKKYRRTPLLVRRNKVAAALEWLKLNHSDYADLEISYDNLREYPEDTPPVVVDYHMVEKDDINDPEATAVNSSESENSTTSGESTMIVHGLVGEELSEL